MTAFDQPTRLPLDIFLPEVQQQMVLLIHRVLKGRQIILAFEVKKPKTIVTK